MNNQNSDNLDKWLQKTVTHYSDTPPVPKPTDSNQTNEKRGFFDKFKKKLAPTPPQNNPQAPQATNRPQQVPQTGQPAHPPRKPNIHPARNHPQNKHHSSNNNKPFHKFKGNIAQSKIQEAQRPKSPYQNKVRFIPLGGLNEVGKNMMAIEYGNDIIILDMGLQFPQEDMLGVDYIVPDITYLKDNLHKIRGVLITHGHLDHIGGISYIAPQLNNPPFFGLKLTTGFIKKQISEHSSCKSLKLVTVQPKQKFKLGVFTINFFRVNHSIPDSTGVIIETPEGLIVHTGDFKFDPTPADGIPSDMETIKWLGTQNVLALFSDSTNSTKPGYAISEKVVGETLDQLIRDTKGRLIIASFSSLIGRMQNIFDSAKKHNRQIFISGRSMVDNIAIATQLGYLKYPKDMVKQLNRSKKEANKENSLIITTGSQGEAMSALTRMAMNEHKQIKITDRDTIVFSSNPIMGNERGIIAVINELSKKGATVISNKVMDVHTTGHGYQEDLKTMMTLIKPKYLIPVHGEYYMRKAHKDLAIQNGFRPEQIILAENGNIIEAKNGIVELAKETVPSNYIMVDNQTGTLSSIAYNIISDRQAMAGNGVIIMNVTLNTKLAKITKLEVKSHGFIYMRETKKLIENIHQNALTRFEAFANRNNNKINKEALEVELKTSAYRLLSEKIERRPLISISINEI